MGRVEAVCISRKKGIVKKPVSTAQVRPNFGIVGDAHAGNGHRQVSLLARESIARIRAEIPNLAHGAFAENLVVSGVDFASLTAGDQIALGDNVLLEVTQIGKECHTACAIRSLVGDCIMPREGLFCRVLRGGLLKPGDVVALQATPEAMLQ